MGFSAGWQPPELARGSILLYMDKYEKNRDWTYLITPELSKILDFLAAKGCSITMDWAKDCTMAACTANGDTGAWGWNSSPSSTRREALILAVRWMVDRVFPVVEWVQPVCRNCGNLVGRMRDKQFYKVPEHGEVCLGCAAEIGKLFRLIYVAGDDLHKSIHSSYPNMTFIGFAAKQIAEWNSKIEKIRGY